MHNWKGILGLLVPCAQILCRGTGNFSNSGSSSGAAQPDPLFPAAAAEAECKISSQNAFICWPEYLKKFLCIATAWPSEILVWIKGSEQSPPSVSTVGISKETRSKEIHYSCSHWLHTINVHVYHNVYHKWSINSYNKPLWWWVCLCSLGVSSPPKQRWTSNISALPTLCWGFRFPESLQCYFSRDSDSELYLFWLPLLSTKGEFASCFFWRVQRNSSFPCL